MADKKVEWVHHETFTSGDIVAKVNVLPVERQRFSVAIGRLANGDTNGRLNLFFPVDQIPDAIHVLEMAYEKHLADEQIRDAELKEKLEKKEEKRKNYLQNVERRKEENRARAHGGGKKGK